MMTTEVMTRTINGIDVDALKQVTVHVGEDPAKGVVEFRVNSDWLGQMRSQTQVESYTLAGEQIARQFSIPADEPVELLGSNTAPNPQELLMAALNACMLVGYAASAAMQGITLTKLAIETVGQLDLRGFLGIAEDVPPGYESLRQTVRIKGNGTPEQFQAIHATVMRNSPNYFNITRPVRLDSTLEIE